MGFDPFEPGTTEIVCIAVRINGLETRKLSDEMFGESNNRLLFHCI